MCEFNKDVWREIVKSLDFGDIANLMLVCKSIRENIYEHFYAAGRVNWDKGVPIGFWRFDCILNLQCRKFPEILLRQNVAEVIITGAALGKLPESIRRLETQNYKGKMPTLPQNLEALYTGNKFNEPLLNLPRNLRELYLGDQFMQDVILPANIKIIYFPLRYDRKVQLPDSIERIRLGYHLQHPIDTIPKSLKYVSYYYERHKKLFKQKASHIKICSVYDELFDMYGA